MATIPYRFGSRLSLRSKEISSEQIREGVFFAGQPDDALLTDARWGRLVNDLMQKQGIPSSEIHTQGPIIDFTSQPQHHFITGLIMLVILGMTGLAALYYYLEETYKDEIAAKKNEEKEEEYKTSHLSIIRKLNPSQVGNKKKEEDTLTQVAVPDDEVHQLNEALHRILNGPRRNQFARFKNATIKKTGNGVSLVFKPAFNTKNVLLAVWNMLFLMAFFYWIGWIMTGTYWGEFGVGFARCSGMVSFGLPGLVGLGYVGFKIKHWYEHRQEDCPPTLEEVLEADELMECCCTEKNSVQQHTVTPFTFSSALERVAAFLTTPFTFSSAFRVGTAFVIGAVGGYSAAQYVLWILSDFIPALLNFTNAFGIAAFVVSALIGGMAASEKHDQIVNTPHNTIEPAELGKKKEEYKEIKLKIKKIKAKRRENEGVIYLAAEKVGEVLNSPCYKAYDYLMSGVFIARVCLFVKTTSPFLPGCFHMAAAAAILSNTATILILVGVGLVWSAFRTCVRIMEEKAMFEKEYNLAVAELNILKKQEQSVTKKKTLVEPSPQNIFNQELSSLSNSVIPFFLDRHNKSPKPGYVPSVNVDSTLTPRPLLRRGSVGSVI